MHSKQRRQGYGPLLLAIILVGAVAAAGPDDSASGPPRARDRQRAAPTQPGGLPRLTLPPLPLGGAPLPRPAEVVRAVYAFAARHAEVLRYVPCFCGCERDGHRANDDCFVASREGGTVKWDPHGMG